MSKQTINVGSGELVGDGEGIRTAFIKINSNFNELYSNTSTGYTGSIGYTGSQGNVGYTGSASTGTTGYTGSQGNVGYTGSASTGTTGYTGSQGNIGYTGSASTGTTVAITSIVRAQRTSGGLTTTPSKWTFTTISGTVTGEWVVNGAAAYPALGLSSNPFIIFTFTGFLKFPSTAYRLGVTGSSPGLTNNNLLNGTITNKNVPNILTSFDTSVHKFAFSEGSTIEEDIYWEFRE